MPQRFVQRVLVIGGGVTGLTTAYRLAKLAPTLEVTLVEAEPRLGGNIATVREQGFVIDGGPDSFLTSKPEALRLARELGLGGELISVQAPCQKLWLAHGGKLVEFPEGMGLGVPTRLLPLLKTPLLSLKGRLRALCEPFVPPLREARAETIAEFFARRVGSELADRIAGPMLSGIFAGDARELSIDATFPGLKALESRFGSLAFGAYAMQRSANDGPRATWRDLPQALRAWHMLPWALRHREPTPNPFASFRRGMLELIEALIRSSPSVVKHVSARATKLSTIDATHHVELEIAGRPSSWVGDRVVIACPVERAAEFVADAELAALFRQVRWVKTATVVFGFRRDEVDHPLDGLGVVVPASEGRISAITMSSSKWAGRAPEGYALLRTYLGGARDLGLVGSASDEALIELALTELRRLLGHLGTPVAARIFRFSRPQPERASLGAAFGKRLGARGGILLAGGGVDVVGIPDCVRLGEAAAREIARAAGSS